MTPPVLVTPPTEAPVSVADVRARGRVAASTSDALIEAMIGAATARLDGYSGLLGRCLVSQTWSIGTGCDYSSCYRLPFAPVSAAIVSFRDAAGDVQTLLDAYTRLDVDAISPKVVLTRGYAWPPSAFDGEGLTISFVAGYGDASKVPSAIKEAIHLYAQHMIDTAQGNGLIRTETVEGVGSTGYFTPDEAGSVLVRLADEMVRPYRRGNL